VALVALLTGLLLELVEELGALLLERLAERVVVLKADTILLHQIVVSKLG
jgi:hypothetical protein